MHFRTTIMFLLSSHISYQTACLKSKPDMKTQFFTSHVISHRQLCVGFMHLHRCTHDRFMSRFHCLYRIRLVKVVSFSCTVTHTWNIKTIAFVSFFFGIYDTFCHLHKYFHLFFCPGALEHLFLTTTTTIRSIFIFFRLL